MAADLRRHDSAAYLEDDEQARAYLAEVVGDGDNAEIAQAIETVARAIGVSKLAKDAGLGRDVFFDAMNGYPAPDEDALKRVIEALGLERGPVRQPKDAAE